MAITIPYAEVKAVQGFLTYLNKNYSKQIDPRDTFLIAAVSAWFRQESGGLSRVIGNNPFNIRNSPLQSSQRVTSSNGRFSVFSTMERGFAAAAYLLMHGGFGAGAKDQDVFGYRLAINALKRGGNQGAVDFLAALAMSSWSATHYGANAWLEAYDPKKNNLLRVYASIGGAQITNPNQPKPKPRKPLPTLARDFNYQVVVKAYLDPWAVSALYKRRRKGRSGSTGNE